VTQDRWRFCSKCFGLWFSGNPDNGVCPAGGAHLAGSGNYSLQTDPGPDQDNWRWCHKCEGLYYNGNVARGVCAAGGAHDVAGSGNYVLQFAAGAGQDNWRWCQQCQGLYFNGNPTNGVCPAWRGAPGDTQHTSAGSENYTLSLTIEQGQPRVSGNASAVLNPQPPLKPNLQITVGGSGFPINISGHLDVAIVEGGRRIASGKVDTNAVGEFNFSKTLEPIPPGVNDGDVWTATAAIGGVTASGDVFVATFPPSP